jgi:hypothetical protein
VAQNMPTCQTKGMGCEGEHIQHICAVIVAADTLHQQYNHPNRQ